MVIGDEIPLSWIYALLAGLVVLGVYFVNLDTALALALIFAGIFIAYKGFEFYKMDEKVMAMALFLFGLFVINYGFTGVGLKQTLFQMGSSGLTILSADYLPYAYADRDFSKTKLNFEKAWVVHFRLDSQGGQYVLSKDNYLTDKQDGVSARDSMTVYGRTEWMRCTGLIEQPVGTLNTYYKLEVKIAEIPAGWASSPEYICTVEGGIPEDMLVWSDIYEYGLFSTKAICVYKNPYRYFQELSLGSVGFSAKTRFTIYKGSTSENINIDMEPGPDYYVGKSSNGKVGILIFNDAVRKNSKFNCENLKNIVPIKVCWGSNCWKAIGYPNEIKQLSVSNLVLALNNYKKTHTSINYDDIKQIVDNEYNRHYDNAICSLNCKVPGLNVNAHVLSEYDKIETDALPSNLYSIPGIMYIDAEWLGIVQAIAKPKLEYFDGDSYSRKVYFEPSQSKVVKVTVKNENSIGGPIKIYLEGCRYISGEMTGSIEPNERRTYSLVVKADNYRLSKGEDSSCMLCVESYSPYIPVSGYKKSKDCKKFYYYLKPSCTHKCRPGEWKCLDKDTAGKCELQPSGCYDFTPIPCPNGCDYRTGKCKGGNVPVCGNGICETWLGENAQNCPQDCGPVPPREKCKDCFEWLRGRIAKLIGGEAVTVCKPKEFTIKFFGFKIFAISQNIYCPIFFIVIGLIILIVLSYLLPALGFIKEILGSAVKRIGEAGKKLAKKR